jgi:hypothetical protein
MIVIIMIIILMIMIMIVNRNNVQAVAVAVQVISCRCPSRFLSLSESFPVAVRVVPSSNRYISVKTRRTPGASDLKRDGTFTEYAILHGTQNAAATHFPCAKNHLMPTFTKKIFGCAEASVRIGMGPIIGRPAPGGDETADACSSGPPWQGATGQGTRGQTPWPYPD